VGGLVAAIVLFLTVSTALVFGIATAYGVLSGIIYLFGRHSSQARSGHEKAGKAQAMTAAAGD
jgi:hypothetical protein